MITVEIAQHFAEAWVDAWNRRDLDAIMEHIADAVEFWSPRIVGLGIASGKFEDKVQVRAYFERGLAANTNLRFTLLQALAGVDSVTIYYRREDGSEVAEVAVLNAEGRAIAVRNHYSASSAVWKT